MNECIHITFYGIAAFTTLCLSNFTLDLVFYHFLNKIAAPEIDLCQFSKGSAAHIGAAVVPDPLYNLLDFDETLGKFQSIKSSKQVVVTVITSELTAVNTPEITC